MTLVRQNGRRSAAGKASGRVPTSIARLIAGLAVLGVASGAGAVILTGGPVYNLPGGGSCTVTGIASQTGGATVSCTGVNLGAHTHVYFGIKNNTNVSGNTMTGTPPAASSGQQFSYASDTASSITYESTTTITDVVSGAEPVDNELVLTLTAGTGSVVSTGGNPSNNGNSDIERLFEITGGSAFTVNATVNAASTAFSGEASTDVYDPDRTTAAGGQVRSRVDLAFYFSDCGDGVVDSPEQCDQGGANGTPGSCCSSTCTFVTAGTVCRPGPGAPCDNSETCTGASGSCPADDAPINLGVVCRTGSGDICDTNETCTGVPGESCPADDAPGNSGIVCRVGSAGDICDMNETCTGTPGATCPPDDAPGNAGVVCRAGSGDLCDPQEVCTGTPGQGCPADIVSNPTTVCRAGSGDSCDPDELCTGTPGQACPADVVEPGTTECRAAAGECDVAELCTGVAGQTCPSDAFEAAATSCNEDADVCTTDECDGAGACVYVEDLDCSDGSACTQDSCDAINGCEYDGAPAVTCTTPVKGKLIYKDKESSKDKADKVVFLWKGGPALINDLGDPTQTTEYELCVYDNTGVQLAMNVQPGANWKTLGQPASPKGYKFKDKNTAQDGVKLVLAKASNLDKAKAKVVAKGVNLPDTATLPFQFPVTAQLYASDGMCWEAQFASGDTKKNEEGKYIGKIQP